MTLRKTSVSDRSVADANRWWDQLTDQRKISLFLWIKNPDRSPVPGENQPELPISFERRQA